MATLNTLCKATVLRGGYFFDCALPVTTEGDEYCQDHKLALGKGDKYDSRGIRITSRIRKHAST